MAKIQLMSRFNEKILNCKNYHSSVCTCSPRRRCLLKFFVDKFLWQESFLEAFSERLEDVTSFDPIAGLFVVPHTG